jgi:hypothetical protein
MKVRHSSIAWKGMAAAANVYRHDYEDVAAKLLSDTLQFGLAAICEMSLHANSLPSSSLLASAVN